jgi:hypothetical protein
MLWAALILAGVPIWLGLGALPFALWNRRQAMRSPGAFACKLREIGPLVPASPRTRRTLTGRSRRSRRARPFPRFVSTAWWVSDVLAVQGALGLTRTRLHAVAAGDAVRPLAGEGVRGLGDAPRSVLLILTDGRLIEVAASGGDTRLLAGPLVSRVPAHRN